MAAEATLKTSVIAIVSSQTAKPYEQVIQSFKASIQKVKPNIEFVQSMDAKKLAKPPDLVFALGSNSVSHSLAEFTDRDLLATMILSDKILKNSKHATALLISASIQKQLEWHQRVLPASKRVGVLFDPEYSQDWVDTARKLAVNMGLEIVAVPVTSARELPSALKLIGRNADSILGITDKTVYSGKTAKSVLLFSFRNRIPFVGLSSAWVKAGALYALDWDYAALGQQSASLALKILDGSSAGEIKPQFPENPIYQLNIKTAKHMKLKLSQELIDGASRVYD